MVYIAQEDRLKLYFPGVTHKLEKKNQSPISKHGIYIVLHPNIPLNVPIFSGLQLSHFVFLKFFPMYSLTPPTKSCLHVANTVWMTACGEKQY